MGTSTGCFTQASPQVQPPGSAVLDSLGLNLGVEEWGEHSPLTIEALEQPGLWEAPGSY